MPVRAKHANALRAAMGRLLEGDAGTTDGRLTWANVHALAGVAKATADRASDVKAEWQRRLGERAAAAQPSTAPPPPEGPATGDHGTAVGLRRTIRTMADHIQALTIAVEHLDERLRHSEAMAADLRLQLSRANGDNVVTYWKG